MSTAAPLAVPLAEDLSPARAAAEDAGVPFASIEFALSLASALHSYGLPSDRLESLMTTLCARLGLEARFFCAPTSIFVSFGKPAELRTCLIRVQPGELDLGRLGELDRLTSDVVHGRKSVRTGATDLARILAQPPRFSPFTNVVCFAVASGTAARLFGGGWTEMAVAAFISLIIGILCEFRALLPGIGGVLEAVAGFITSAVCVVAARHLDGLAVEVTTLAALIVFLPGLTLTTALTELATKNLIAGTSRLLAAAIVFLELAFGVALGGRIGQWIEPGPAHWSMPEAPAWTTAPSLVLGMLALALLFRVRRRDIGWIVLAGALAYVGASVGTHLFGPQLGAFVGALALGCGANVYARLLDRPALVANVPGLMMLVPGSIGFRSLESLLANDVLTGIANAFSMVLVAVAIVAGLLLANAIVPSGKAL